MQIAAEFITGMSSLAFNELVANLPFTDLVALARTNRELYERLTGGFKPPTDPEQHAIHSSGRAYAWQGLLDKLGNEFGIHTDPDNCQHPNPALRKKVAKSMRQYINNDTNNPVPVLRNELDQITAQFYETRVTPTGGNNSGLYSEARYLNWRRTVVLFRLLVALTNAFEGRLQWSPSKKPSLRFDNSAFWGVVVRSGSNNTDAEMLVVTDFVNIPTVLANTKLVTNKIVFPKRYDVIEQIGSNKSGCIFFYRATGTFENLWGIEYVDPNGSGDETLIEKGLLLENVHFAAQYVNRSDQDRNDVDIVFMLTLKQNGIDFYGWWTPGKSVQMIVGENFVLPPVNESDLATWYSREPNVTVARVNLNMFEFPIGPNPYVAVFSRISDGVNTVTSYLPVKSANDRLKPLFRSQRWFVKNVNSSSSSITFSDPRNAPFVYNRMRRYCMFTPIERDQTFWFASKRSFTNVASGDSYAEFVNTNIIIDVAKFKRDKLQKRLSFVIGNKAYITGENRQSHMLGFLKAMFIADNKIYLGATGLDEATDSYYTTFIIIDVETQRITEAFLNPSDSNDYSNNFQSLTLSVDDYTLSYDDANRQRRVQ